jgi:hypothetical protein
MLVALFLIIPANFLVTLVGEPKFLGGCISMTAAAVPGSEGVVGQVEALG